MCRLVTRPRVPGVWVQGQGSLMRKEAPGCGWCVCLAVPDQPIMFGGRPLRSTVQCASGVSW
jgi:hypothetical protein